MDAKPGPKKKSGNTRRSIDAGEKDQLIIELKTRIAVLEQELRLKQEDTSTEGLDERKRAEEALRESEAKFRALFEGAGVAILVADVATGRIIDCNGKAEELIGRPRDEIIGLHQTQVHPEDRAEVQREQFARHARGIVINNDEALVQHRDGRLIPVMINAAPLEVNGREILIGFFLDITERKLAEEALRESEHGFRGVFEQAPLGVALVDSVTGRFLQVNQKYCDIVGLTQVEMLATDFQSITHRDDLQESLDNIDRMLRGGITSYNLEKRYIHANGSIVWVNLTVVPLWEADSTYKSHIAMVEDITERKRAEGALRDSEERYRGLFESSVDGIIITDLAGNILKVNPAFLKMLGYSMEELRRLSYQQLTPARWHESEARIVREQIFERGYSDEYEKEYIRKDCSIFPISIRVWLSKDKQGQLEGMWGIVRDITERKLAEEALRESESRFRQLSESLPQLIWTCLADGRCDYLSPQWVSYTGIPEDVQLGYGWLDQVHPDDRGRVEREWTAAAARGEPFDIEFRIRRHDGDYRWFKTRATPIRDEAGHLVKWFGSNTDINDLKQAEEGMKEAKQQAELYLDLMGHDISNMHQIALGYLELVGDMPPGVQQNDMIEKSIEVLQRSTQLIRNVRKLQKINDEFLHTHVVDVGGMLHTVHREFGAVPGKNVTLNLYGHEHCYVRANELLFDVLANLVSNAIKHTGDRADIDISLDAVNDNSGRYCRVSVEDNGPGIPDDFKDKIFNRMLKGTDKAKGMGLGLYLVKSLVDSYGGRVWVEDRVQGDHTQGARFVVMLPAVGD